MDDGQHREAAAEAAYAGTDSVTEFVHATVIGADRIAKADRQTSTSDGGPGSAGVVIGLQIQDVVPPPFDLRMLFRLHEHSNALRQNVDSYATNIDGFGHHFEAALKLDADDVIEKVREAMYLDRLLQTAGGSPEKIAEPTDEEVQQKVAELKRLMMVEHALAKSFFEFCSAEVSFVTLRRRTRSDLEICGNAYWEIIRGKSGQPTQIAHMPAHTVRLIKRDGARVDVDQVVQRGPITFAKERISRAFRRFVQLGDETVWFKELGDPRALSSKTGKFYATEALLEREEPGVPPANEVLHFVVHASTSSYGVPRWIGNLLSVLGSRHAEEVNFLYFENKTIPPLAILVSGGRMGQDSVARIKSFVDTELKGKRNFHKVLILEAESQSAAAMMGLENAGRCRIEIRPLTEAHLKDALFQEYDERNIDKVGYAFRLPRLLRGDIRDFNRASAQAALEFAESQVFGPERVETDFAINRQILPALGIRYWRFLSDGPRITDPAEMADIVTKLTVAGVLVPKDGREICEDRVFYRELNRIDGDWVEQPIPLTAAGFPLDMTDDDEIPSPGGAVGLEQKPTAQAARKRLVLARARRLIAMRDELDDAEAAEAARELRTAKRQVGRSRRTKVDDDDPAEVIPLSPEDMRKRFDVG